MSSIECNYVDLIKVASDTLPRWASVDWPHRSTGYCTSLYFARSSAGLVKIGRSDCPEFRFGQLSFVGELSMVVTVAECHPSAEQILHWLFRHDRYSGEWFIETPDLSALIAACVEAAPPCSEAVPVEPDKSVGETVRLWRKSCGMKQIELAGRLGVAQSFVSQIESGQRTPSLDVICALHRVTGGVVSFDFGRLVAA